MKLGFIISISLLSFFAKGQTDSGSVSHIPKGFISINGGIAIPVRQFSQPAATTSVSTTPPASAVGFGDSAGGFALSGISINVFFGIPIKHSHLGIAGKLGYTSNPFDINRLINNMNDYYATSQYNLLYVGSVKGNYTEYSIMPGGFYSTRYNNLSIDISLLIGPIICQTPDVMANNISPGPYVSNSEFKSATAFKFGAELHLGIRYAFTDKICAVADLGYMHTIPTFNISDYFTRPTSNGDVTTIYKYSTYVNITIITASLGISYQIGK
jgi:hypothetical protein